MRRHRPGPRRQSPVSYESVAEDARIEWFWRAAKIGQSRVEVPDLGRLTDAAGRADFGSPEDHRSERLGAVAPTASRPRT